MKKMILPLLCAIMLLSCASCKREITTLVLTQDADQIEKIQIVDIADEDDLLVKELDTQLHSEFVQELTAMPYYEIFNPPVSSLGGISIRIHYLDRNYEVISCFGRYQSHTDNFDGWYYFEREDYQAFLEKYGVKIEN